MIPLLLLLPIFDHQPVFFFAKLVNFQNFQLEDMSEPWRRGQYYRSVKGGYCILQRPPQPTRNNVWNSPFSASDPERHHTRCTTPSATLLVLS